MDPTPYSTHDAEGVRIEWILHHLDGHRLVSHLGNRHILVLNQSCPEQVSHQCCQQEGEGRFLRPSTNVLNSWDMDDGAETANR